MRNDYCTSFVLSESSLFVYDKHLMIKTCGRTRLLKFLEPLQEQIELRDLDLFLQRVIYSRKNYYFPEAQFAPHRSWEEEHTTLNKMLPGGKYHIMGSSQDEDQWYTYTWENASLSAASEEEHAGEHSPVFEVMMMNLSPSKMEQFYQKGPCEEIPCNSNQLATGEVKYGVTEESGIVNLVPDSMIDDFQFDPCGYSMNGLKGRSYWTIHITPEAQCSYVSFETNVELPSRECYLKMMKKLLRTFEPGRFTVTLYGREISMSDIVDLPLQHFDSLSSEQYQFSNGERTVAMCNYMSYNDAYEQRELMLVKKVLQERLAEQQEEEEGVTPFYLVNTSVIESQMQWWRETLPRVKPLYTVSCNSSPRILNLVHALGAGFDCTSAKDIASLSHLKDADITFSNPFFKQVKDLVVASSNHVQHITIDGDLSELEKIARHAPNAKLLLRVNTSEESVFSKGTENGSLSLKGCRPEHCTSVLQKARQLNLNIVGVSLVNHFENTVTSARRVSGWTEEALPCIANQVFDIFRQFGYQPSMLDIGGSIWSMGIGLDDDRPGYDTHWQGLAEEISSGLNLIFPAEKWPGLKIVASDCGSFLVSKSHTLVCQVVGRKQIAEKSPAAMAAMDSAPCMEYYINDGYFGSVSQRKAVTVVDRHHHKPTISSSLHHHHHEEVVSEEQKLKELLTPHLDVRALKTITATTEFYNSHIFGPSCDKSLDCLCRNISLPKLDVGDVCYFMNMGAVQHYDRTRSSADYVYLDE